MEHVKWIVVPEIIKMSFEGMAEPKIICAANVYYSDRFTGGYLIVPGPRHHCPTMHNIIDQFIRPDEPRKFYDSHKQGFIDQFGNFYTREQAFQLTQLIGQPINMERNGCDFRLYSEGLY